MIHSFYDFFSGVIDSISDDGVKYVVKFDDGFEKTLKIDDLIRVDALEPGQQVYMYWRLGIQTEVSLVSELVWLKFALISKQLKGCLGVQIWITGFKI